MPVTRTRGVIVAVVVAALAATVGPAVPAGAAAPALVGDPVPYVDPFIGSSRGGNTWPGAARPFGMIAWSPTTTNGDQTSTPGSNGYEYGASRVRGFSLTHVNGAGCHPGAAGDVPIMPFAGEMPTSPSADSTDAVYASGFSHANESASPGRYAVTLDSGARTDLAVSTRAGIGDFTFPADRPANLLFRTSNSLNGSEDAEVTIDPATRTVTGSVLTGGFCARRGNGGGDANPNRRSYYRLFFSAVFDRDFASTGTWKDATITRGGRTATGGEGYLTGAARAGRGSGGWVGFDAAADRDVRVRIGISYVDLAGAVRNRDAEIPAGATVDSVAAQARDEWRGELNRIRVGGGSQARRTAFYTGIYHALLQPQTVSDVDGRYLGADMAVHTITKNQNAQLGTFSGWDQYRAQIQLLALLRPDVAGDMAQSMLAFANQNRGIWDRWLHLGAPTHVMTGDPAAPTLATFAAMGVTNFDARAAFASLYRQATVQNPEALDTRGCPGQCVAQRAALEQYLALKYAPQDTCACWGGAAETLENSLADHSLAMWARRLGDETAAAAMLERASYWRNTFNPAATAFGGYQQARNADGTWVGGFTPSTDRGFAQGSSATYTWMVPQDVGGLGELMGGGHVAVERLDRFFRDENGNWAVGGGSAVRYDPTNEPGIHVPWMYNGLGQPFKTQEVVRRIVDTVYGVGPAGLPGNDDLGTMSAWYVFAAMGVFPQTPGRAELLVAAPVFPRIEIRRSNGIRLYINANPNSGAAGETDPFVQKLELGGVARTQSWLPESFVRKGGVATFTVGARPRIGWATEPGDLPRDHVTR